MGVPIDLPHDAEELMHSNGECQLKAPINWPSQIRFQNQPKHSIGLTDQQRNQLHSRPTDLSNEQPLTKVKIPLMPSQRIAIQPINNSSHPAHNQFGLFAAQPLPPGILIVPYLGLVHSNDVADTDPNSDYDISLDRDIGLSVDARRTGNEARMVNDYRGVPRPASTRPVKRGQKLGPNAEFRDLWLEFDNGVGELGIGIFVMAAGRTGKGSAGIARGEEILVNYGKGFWKERSEGSG